MSKIVYSVQSSEEGSLLRVYESPTAAQLEIDWHRRINPDSELNLKIVPRKVYTLEYSRKRWAGPSRKLVENTMEVE